jgi:hypothetical protein
MDLLGRVPVRRDWPRTWFRLVAAVLAAVVAVVAIAFAWTIVTALAEAGCFMYVLLAAAVFLLVASPLAVFILLKKAWIKSCRAQCPHCNANLTSLAPGSNLPLACPACGEFVEGDGGFIQTVAHDRIAQTPLFSCPLMAPPRWPPGCCVCGAPATRSEKFRSATLGALLEIPHCAAHKQGAELIDGPPPMIRFRSYPYLRAFRELQKAPLAPSIPPAGPSAAPASPGP